MQCPNDGATLLMTDRQGVEIDYCPTCRGVWLDRGELDKIIERSGVDDDDDDRRPRAVRAGVPDPGAPPPPPPPPREYYDDRRGGYRDDRSYKRKKKRSFLEDIFDFD